MRMHARLRRSRAFTLVELSIVVVVIGILAVIGVAIYRRHKATARTLEATDLTAAIRTAQEAYKSEKGVYAEVSANTDQYYPAAAPGQFVTAWGGDCTNCANGDVAAWKKLALHPTGPVMYGYATVARVGGSGGSGGGGLSAPSGLDGVMPAPGDVDPLKATDPFYATVAWGDSDADGVPCIVLSYSTSNQIVVQSAGE